jgi:hypothetical protein
LYKVLAKMRLEIGRGEIAGRRQEAGGFKMTTAMSDGSQLASALVRRCLRDSGEAYWWNLATLETETLSEKQ